MRSASILQKAIVIFAGLMCVGALLAGALGVLHGAEARTPGKFETQVMGLAKHRILVGSKAMKNPLPSSRENVVEGQQNFSHYCYVCHGLDGQNTGVPFAQAMSPPVPSLASREVQSYTDGQLFWVIKNGLWPSGMPASRGILTDEEIWSIVIYVRNLPGEGSLGEPPAYGGEGCASPAEKAARALSTRLPTQND